MRCSNWKSSIRVLQLFEVWTESKLSSTYIVQMLLSKTNKGFKHRRQSAFASRDQNKVFFQIERLGTMNQTPHLANGSELISCGSFPRFPICHQHVFVPEIRGDRREEKGKDTKNESKAGMGERKKKGTGYWGWDEDVFRIHHLISRVIRAICRANAGQSRANLMNPHAEELSLEGPEAASYWIYDRRKL